MREGLPYDLILMDESMPGCSGIDATLAIRKYVSLERPKVRQPVICCLSSHADHKLKKQAKEAGVDALVKKPIFASGILQLLAKVIK